VVIAIVSLVVAAVTLFIAVLIHSEARDVLGHVNAITYTLPGAYDIERAKKDIERTGEIRARVICVAPKHTHLAYEMPFSKVPRGLWTRTRIWELLRGIATRFSGDIEVPVEMPQWVKWEIKPSDVKGPELDKLLSGGWEPFSVTSEDRVWLRRMVKQEET
jgi:hypothetical protein